MLGLGEGGTANGRGIFRGVFGATGVKYAG